MSKIQWRLKTHSTGCTKSKGLVSRCIKIYEDDTHETGVQDQQTQVIVPCIPLPEECHPAKHYEHPTDECSNHMRQQ
jgi:hypothetical protein